MESKFFLSMSCALSNRPGLNVFILESFWVWSRYGSRFLLNRKDVVYGTNPLLLKCNFLTNFWQERVFFMKKKTFFIWCLYPESLSKLVIILLQHSKFQSEKYYYRLLWFEVFLSNLVYHNLFQIHHEKFEY